MALENNGNGTPLKREGYYQHRNGGPIVYVEATPDIGTPIIDAYVSAGYEFIGTELPEGSEDVSGLPGFTTATDKNGRIQYRHNGKLISKEEYDKSLI